MTTASADESMEYSIHSSNDHVDRDVAVLIEGAMHARSAAVCTVSLALPAASLSVDAIRHAVAAKLGLGIEDFHLLHQTQLLRSDHLLLYSTPSPLSSPSSFLSLRFLLRSSLLGGKGGFGSLLRSATTKVGAKKTSNFSASRDLSGRRMRHVEAEKKIEEWNRQHHEPVNQTELQAKYKAIKEGRDNIPVCKWGATCKYRYSTCRRSHPPDPEEEVKQGDGEAHFPEELGYAAPSKPASKRQMQDAVMAGLARGKKRVRESKEEEEGEGEEEEDAMEDEAEEEEQQQSDDEDDQPPSKRLHTTPSSSAAAAASSTPDEDDWLRPMPPSTSVFAKPYAADAAASSSAASYPDNLHAPQVAPEEAEKVMFGMAAVLQKVKSKVRVEPAQAPAAAAASSPATAAAAAAPTVAPASFDPIDLSTIASIDSLVEFPLPHLTAELTRVGLKAGGTPRQRAERLWLLKDTPFEKLPAKVKAQK